MLKTLEAPEIVFGLCSAIGTDNSKIVRLIEDTLKSYSYHAEYFKVTNLMRSVILNHHELVEKPIEKRYDTYIKYANKLRELFEDDGVLGTLCCAALKSFRRQREDLEGSYLPSHAYIFDQFKRKEEIATLRQVYGRLFVMISIYSDKQSRINNLSERIAQDHAVARPDLKHLHMARRLVERDEEEEEIESGQRLRDAFPMADVFVNIDDMISARHVLERFLSAFFGSNSTSPTRDEYGMYLAKSAALRSLDLSRQVGAAIFAKEGEIISLGSNEVPKAGGGTYWVDDGDDAREYKVGRDENERIKRAILADLVRRLKRTKYIKSKFNEEEAVASVLAEP